MKHSSIVLLVLATVLTACGKDAGLGVDTVFLNANVYTVNEEQPTADAIAIDDGVIVYVGDAAATGYLLEGTAGMAMATRQRKHRRNGFHRS